MTLTSTAYANGTSRDPRADYQTREFERADFEAIDFDPWTDDHDQRWELADDLDDSSDEGIDDEWIDEPVDERWRPTTRRRAALTSRRRAAFQASALDEWDDLDDEPHILRRRWKTFALAAIACAGILGIATQALQTSSAAPQVGSLNYYYQRGYYVDNGWLCYGWANGAYHCTAHWHKSGSTLVSDNPSWVPNVSGAAQPAAAAPKTGLSVSPQSFATSGEPCKSSVHFVANISQWAVPPGCYGNVYYPSPANFVYRSGFGWCNWWPEVLHPNQPNLLWGAGYRRSSVPAVGAAVFFAGGVQGASSAGHYAEVVAISSDHYWVLVSEMNFYWRGAGWQKVDYRYIHVGAGVTFIYP